MNDLIDRQAAIDFIDAGHLCNPNELRWSDNDVVNFLKKRPSAEPEDAVMLDKETILQAGYKNREVEFRIGGRLFRVREVAQ